MKTIKTIAISLTAAMLLSTAPTPVFAMSEFEAHHIADFELEDVTVRKNWDFYYRESPIDANRRQREYIVEPKFRSVTFADGTVVSGDNIKIESFGSFSDAYTGFGYDGYSYSVDIESPVTGKKYPSGIRLSEEELSGESMQFTLTCEGISKNMTVRVKPAPITEFKVEDLIIPAGLLPMIKSSGLLQMLDPIDMNANWTVAFDDGEVISDRNERGDRFTRFEHEGRTFVVWPENLHWTKAGVYHTTAKLYEVAKSYGSMTDYLYDTGFSTDVTVHVVDDDQVRSEYRKYQLGEYETLPMGDANLDETVDVTDATLVQLHAAGAQLLDISSHHYADVNADGIIDVTDATLIQLKTAGKTEF